MWIFPVEASCLSRTACPVRQFTGLRFDNRRVSSLSRHASRFVPAWLVSAP